jgi:diguanylate cyclase (GGDEF)-like protein/PAS domain S-box-containing protein
MAPKKKPIEESEITERKKPTAKIASSQSGFPIEGTSDSAGELEALRESEERYRLLLGILQSSSDGILAVNQENNVLFANERFVEMWRIPQEVLAKKDDALLLQYVLDQLSDPQGFLQKVQELYNSVEESFDTLYFKDGRVFDRLSRPLLQKTELRGRVWSFRDITAHKQAQEKLAASEAELRALFAGMTDVVIVYDVDGHFVKIAPTDPANLLRPAQEMLGKTLHEILPKEQADYIVAKVRESIQSGRVVAGEYTLEIGGKERWRSASFSPLSETTAILVAHDITAQKRAEDALQRAEQRYRGLFEDAPAMYVITRTVEGSPVIVDCNELFSRTLGYSRDELLGQAVADLYSPASRIQLLEGGYRRALAGEFKTEERELLARDGRIVPTVVRAVPEVDPAGNVSGTRAMFIDITERRQAEEELRSIKNELEIINLELRQSLEREKLLACTDGLTNLCNHRYFFELAAREFKAAARYRHSLTFLMFDMDHFKHVNDTLGHAAGDKLLVKVAQATNAHVRASDVVARYGGDEFIVMLPHASAQKAILIAERIRTSIAAIPVEIDKEPFVITLSIGIAETRYEPMDENVERIIQCADEAMYKAKQSGRNRTVIFGQDET